MSKRLVHIVDTKMKTLCGDTPDDWWLIALTYAAAEGMCGHDLGVDCEVCPACGRIYLEE